MEGPGVDVYKLRGKVTPQIKCTMLVACGPSSGEEEKS
jgi:hypothetical protein